VAIFRRKDERILNHQTTQDWQGVFLHFDRDRSGSIDGNELQAALAQFGYRLSPQLLNLVQRKYGAVLLLPVVICSRSST
jgi:Ca2+-binding EF-hand superfamily protein